MVLEFDPYFSGVKVGERADVYCAYLLDLTVDTGHWIYIILIITALFNNNQVISIKVFDTTITHK